jgi:hypothetical protein
VNDGQASTSFLKDLGPPCTSDIAHVQVRKKPEKRKCERRGLHRGYIDRAGQKERNRRKEFRTVRDTVRPQQDGKGGELQKWSGFLFLSRGRTEHGYGALGESTVIGRSENETRGRWG